jgi:hypothetical protein
VFKDLFGAKGGKKEFVKKHRKDRKGKKGE